MKIQAELEVVSVTSYDFKNDDGEQIRGAKFFTLDPPRDPSKVKGKTITAFNAPFELFAQAPLDLPKKCKVILEMTGKTTRIVGFAQ